MKKFLLLISLVFIAPTLWATETTTAAPTPPPTSTTTSSATPATSTTAVISKNDFLQKERELEQALPLIRQQVMETIQSVNQQEQKISEQIAKLEMQNAQLNEQINKLSLQLNESRQQLSHEVQQVQQQTQSTQQTGFLKWAIAVFIISFALIATTLLIPTLRRKRKQASISATPSTPAPEEEVEKEYDFMSSQEAVPVKLNLARAYLEMGDHQAASDVLQTVLEQGNEEQRAEAENLMSSIKV